MKKELSEFIRLSLSERDRIVNAAEKLEDSRGDQTAVDQWNERLADSELITNAFIAAKAAARNTPDILAELKAARDAQIRLHGIDFDEASWASIIGWHSPPFTELIETVKGLPSPEQETPSTGSGNDESPPNARVSVNDQMKNIYTNDRLAAGWTAAEWASQLGGECDDSTVRKTNMWKATKAEREAIRRASGVGMRRNVK